MFESKIAYINVTKRTKVVKGLPIIYFVQPQEAVWRDPSDPPFSVKYRVKRSDVARVMSCKPIILIGLLEVLWQSYSPLPAVYLPTCSGDK